ncbi:MAG TPA: ABC transporter ATP-binding protein [Candidatus Dormibacteraeota bacterium]|nr:ABC transporter ATP-binding protein [Candidatus Dormibacteraeota bacterium]
MSLVADVHLRLGDFRLDVPVRVEPGEVVAVVGPNGAGKTSLLRALAGLIPLDAGRVELDGEVLEEGGVRRMPPERRPVGVVFQDHLLFPHLSALDNVAFGLRMRGVSRSDARRRAASWLERVGLAGHAAARPRALSGGQAQRVALARALVTEPRLLLLDEPLAAVDASARVELRRALRTELAAHPGARLLVTHDPLEAMALADRLLVLENGRLVQEGPIAEVTARPRSAWVAAMVGLNLFRGSVEAGVMRVVDGPDLTVVTDLCGDAFAVVHPRAVGLHRTRPDGSARNVWPGEADSLDLEGDRVRVRIAGPVPIVAEVTPAAIADLGLVAGGEVWVSVKATEVSVYPD